MPNRSLGRAVSLLALSAALGGCSDTKDAAESGQVELTEEGIAELTQLADAAVAAGIPGVSMAILRDGQTVTIARGKESLDAVGNVTPEHRFRMASIAKSFVASMILQLAEEGVLNLSDTLEHWLPGVLPASGAATLEQLLRLESGIFDFARDERHMAPYIQGDFDFQWQPAQLVAMANEHPPDFAPGTGWAYSNTNYVLLGMILEKIEGESLERIASRRIAEPLGLRATTMETDSDMTTPFARGYLVGVADTPLDVTRISASAVFGNGNLVSTPLEVAQFYRALARGEVVDERRVSEMFALDPKVPSRYGMGVFRFEDLFACGTFIGHDGMTPGYDVAGYTSEDGRRQFAIAVNSSTLDEKAGTPAAHEAFAKLVRAVGCR